MKLSVDRFDEPKRAMREGNTWRNEIVWRRKDRYAYIACMYAWQIMIADIYMCKITRKKSRRMSPRRYYKGV